MVDVELGTVIAERMLQSLKVGKKVTVRIGSPRKTDQNDFITPYQIVGAGDERVRFAAGLDAVQSLQLVFPMIGADLNYLLKDYELRWANGDDAGFPKP